VKSKNVTDVTASPVPTVTCARHVSARTREKGAPVTSVTFSDETAEFRHSGFAAIKAQNSARFARDESTQKRRCRSYEGT